MFNEETCNRCGVCLNKCQFLQLPIEKAKKEISKLIKTGNSMKIMMNCASCTYCNVICPTQSNPSDLINKMRVKKIGEFGLPSLAMRTEENPHNVISLSLELNSEVKKVDMVKYLNPPKSEKMFYLGCAVPAFYPDIAKTKLLEEYPIMGGLKYCCKGMVYKVFGESEARIIGKDLLKNFKKLGIKELITFCPDCEVMFKHDYPSIVEDWDIGCQNIIEYFLEKYHNGELKIKNKVNLRVAFQDSCQWRDLDREVYNAPREFLEIIGCTVVEMKHSKEKSLCCGSPVEGTNKPLARKIGEQKIAEAEEVQADALAFLCPGCIYTLGKYASEKNIDSYYITELAQMAIGEKVVPKIPELTHQIKGHLIKKIKENPNIVNDRFIVKDGKIKQL